MINYFALDLTSNRKANLTGLTHESVNTIFLTIRLRLSEDCQLESPLTDEDMG